MYSPFDVQLQLRDVNDGAEVATVSEAGLALAVRAAPDFKAIFFVTALDTVDLNETYVLSVEVDSVAAFNDAPVKVGEVTVTEAKVYELPLSGDQIEQLDPDAAAIRCTATIGGTTPSIIYGCYLVPAV